MIIISDLHLRYKEVYFNFQKKFLNWIQNNFNNEIIVFLGDIFDNSPHWEVYSYFKSFLLNRNNETHILQGNHDYSRIKGPSLKGIHLIKNVKVYFKESETNLENFKCLMLPWQQNIKYYENIEFKGDFCFTHLMLKEESFGNEYINLSKIKAKKIYGHLHLKKQYENGNIIIPGTPYPTRNLEVTNPILKINKNGDIEEINTPEFFKIETVKFGDKLPNKEWLYNFTDVPSITSLYKRYKGYHIREEGIKFNFNTEELKKIKINKDTIPKEFNDWAKEEQLASEHLNCCNKYLDKYFS